MHRDAYLIGQEAQELLDVLIEAYDITFAVSEAVAAHESVTGNEILSVIVKQSSEVISRLRNELGRLIEREEERTVCKCCHFDRMTVKKLVSCREEIPVLYVDELTKAVG